MSLATGWSKLLAKQHLISLSDLTRLTRTLNLRLDRHPLILPLCVLPEMNSLEVSYFAQISNGQGHKRIMIETPSKSIFDTFHYLTAVGGWP